MSPRPKMEWLEADARLIREIAVRRLLQPLGLLIGVQAVCLAIGFWFQFRLTGSNAEYSAAQATWQQLEQEAISFRQSLTADLTKDPTNKLLMVELQRRCNRLPSSVTNQMEFVLVDGSGSVIGEPDHGEASFKVGDHISWKSESPGVSEPGGQFVRVHSNSSERLGVVLPLSSGHLRLLVASRSPADHFTKEQLWSSSALAAVVAFAWTLVICAVASQLLLSHFNITENHQRQQRDQEALRSAQDLLRTRDAVIFGLAKLAESRDPETGEHLERISLYSMRLATALRQIPKYQAVVTPNFIRLLGISSVLHDIGKVGLEDTVLLKPGSLSEEERRRMQKHTLVAADCLRGIEQRLGASNFLQTAREIALHHHERWDGQGYPGRLVGDAIPLAARIVSICDVYDALRSKRIYKEAMPHVDCVKNIRQGAGNQFDPELVEIFLSIESEFAEIALQFSGVSGPSREIGKQQEIRELQTPQWMTSEQEERLKSALEEEASSDCVVTHTQ